MNVEMTRDESRIWMHFQRSQAAVLLNTIIDRKLEEWREAHEGKPDSCISKARVQAIQELKDIINAEAVLWKG